MSTRHLLLLAALASCGGSDGDGEPAPGAAPSTPVAIKIPADKRLLPLKVGATWAYRVIDAGVTSMKVHTVEALEAVPLPAKGMVMAYRVKTRKGATDQTVSWQEDLGSIVVRHLEHSYAPGGREPNLKEHWDPYKVRLDEHPDRLKPGSSWTVNYNETHEPVGGLRTMQMRSERWTVMSVNETVQVPAGTYRNVVLLRRVGTDAGATSDKQFWYAPGVGKVKETGGQVEELMSVTGL